jgi:hypothetical protein
MNIHNKKRLDNICVPLKDELFDERLRRRNRVKCRFNSGWMIYVVKKAAAGA